MMNLEGRKTGTEGNGDNKDMTQKIKPLLIPPMVLLELSALAIGWALAWTHKPTARRWAAF